MSGQYIFPGNRLTPAQRAANAALDEAKAAAAAALEVERDAIVQKNLRDRLARERADYERKQARSVKRRRPR
jgi:hypothetical protein